MSFLTRARPSLARQRFRTGPPRSGSSQRLGSGGRADRLSLPPVPLPWLRAGRGDRLPSPRKTSLYGLDSLYERVKGVWVERFERSYGFWRGLVDDVIASYFRCGVCQGGFARVRFRRCPEEFLVARCLPVVRSQAGRFRSLSRFPRERGRYGPASRRERWESRSRPGRPPCSPAPRRLRSGPCVLPGDPRLSRGPGAAEPPDLRGRQARGRHSQSRGGDSQVRRVRPPSGRPRSPRRRLRG